MSNAMIFRMPAVCYNVTFGDLQEAFAAVERTKYVLLGTDIDEALAYGL